MDHEKKIKPYQLIMLAIPWLIGFGGYCAAGMRSWDTAFSCLQMYTLNFSEKPVNGWVELARWLAPATMFGGVLMLVTSAYSRFAARVTTVLFDSVAVYGPEADAHALLSQLGLRGIMGKEQYLPADNYILLNDSAWNDRFLKLHWDALKKKQVYLRSDELPMQSVAEAGLHLFCPSEIVARAFWKKGELYQIASKAGFQTDVALIGFGKLGEELLYWGLQDNLFSPEQRIRYHVFGDAADFLRSHPNHRLISDPVVANDDSWMNHIEDLKRSGMILVLPAPAEGVSQERTVFQLLSLLPDKRLTVFSEDSAMLRMLDAQEPVSVVDIARESMQVSLIMGEQLIRDAMQINMRYHHENNGVEETEENSRRLWENASTFERYSNIGAADYHELLRKIFLDDAATGPDAATMRKLAELEHMRWCRLYWLNNWSCGDPGTVKNGDEKRRIHRDLRPYGELPEEEHKKDYDTIKALLKRRENGGCEVKDK